MQAPDPQSPSSARAEAAPGMARYLAIWAAALGLMLGAIIGFCALVDPYAVLGVPPIAGLTRDKPAAADWPRITKAYMVQRSHPATLIIGNSTADVGFNPDSAAWPGSKRPVFNLAIDGGLPSTHVRYLQHALSVIHPAHVLLAVNFIETMIMPPHRLSAAAQDQFAFEPRMLVLPDGAPNPGYARAHFADMVFSTLSFDAVADSIETILHQGDARATFETPAGWNDGGKFRRWAREDGFYSLFMNKDREKIPQFARWRQHRMLDIAALVQAVRLARAHGADVTLAILPNHSDEMDALRQLGLDADYDAWKTALVAGVTAADAGAAIWDFSGYTQYTTEPVPPAGDHATRLHWFWEPVHFQSELGDRMIARMNGAAAPADLGTRVTPATLPADIAAFHAGEAAWVGAHPADVRRIGAIIANLPHD